MAPLQLRNLNQSAYGVPTLDANHAARQLDQAILAERAGWDGVFGWEAGFGVDAWTLLSAIAARTTRVRLGTLRTPEAGCTWWLETRTTMPHHSDERMAEVDERLRAGPPRSRP